MISAVTCALAGINLSVEQAGAYSLNMSAARGLICLAAINCGRRKPVQSCLFAIIFGFSGRCSWCWQTLWARMRPW